MIAASLGYIKAIKLRLMYERRIFDVMPIEEQFGRALWSVSKRFIINKPRPLI